MRRREFIAGVGSAAVAWPLVARAQKPAMPVIGYLGLESEEFDAVRLANFRQGLNEAGFVEGRDVASEYRGAGNQLNRLQALATDLVHRPVSLIAAIGGPASAVAAKGATDTIPIVFIIATDPVELGLVASLSRPGGNITGVTSMAGAVLMKQLEMLHETVPRAAVIGLLVNPNNPIFASYMKDVRAETEARGQKVLIVKAGNENEFEAAFAVLVRERADAIIVPSDALFNSRPNQLVALAARHGLPAVYSYGQYAKVGGLMSYGVDFASAFRQAGAYAGRILKGEKPGDLPVVQVANIELVLNRKTAKALGLTFPPPLLARADEVIE